MWGQASHPAALIGAVMIAPAVMAGAPSVHAQSAGDVFTVALPVIVDDRRLPSLLVETSITEVTGLPPSGLASVLSGLLNPDAARDLAALGSDMHPVGELEALGYGVRLNAQTLTIDVTIPVAARSASTASLAEDWDLFKP